MKHSLLYFAMIASLAACTSNPKKDLSTDVTVLTPASNPGAYSNALSDTATNSQELLNDDEASIPVTPTRKKVKQRTRQSQSANYPATETVYQPQVPVVMQPTADPVVVPTNSGNQEASTNTSSGGNTETAAAPIPEIKQEKKGWSKAAQGAVIGGVAGAVGGAILSKNKGKGAIIGGVVGAAGGYILGRSKDKKANQFVAN